MDLHCRSKNSLQHRHTLSARIVNLCMNTYLHMPYWYVVTETGFLSTFLSKALMLRSLCWVVCVSTCRAHKVRLPSKELDQLVRATDNYSGSDMAALCREAAMEPIRELGPAVASVSVDRIRAINLQDFGKALQVIKPSVNLAQVKGFLEFTRDYGTS